MEGWRKIRTGEARWMDSHGEAFVHDNEVRRAAHRLQPPCVGEPAFHNSTKNHLALFPHSMRVSSCDEVSMNKTVTLLCDKLARHTSPAQRFVDYSSQEGVCRRFRIKMSLVQGRGPETLGRNILFSWASWGGRGTILLHGTTVYRQSGSLDYLWEREPSGPSDCMQSKDIPH